MMLGLRTAIYHVPDLQRAKAWYAEAFGVAPYFDERFYVGFNIGGYELGLDPDIRTVGAGARGVVAYWGVADVQAAVDHYTRLGASLLVPVPDVGDDIRVATVADPFGNPIGLIQNPHFAAS
jgi:predicted enzyme related to lactoylglutathione lyase